MTESYADFKPKTEVSGGLNMHTCGMTGTIAARGGTFQLLTSSRIRTWAGTEEKNQIRQDSKTIGQPKNNMTEVKKPSKSGMSVVLSYGDSIV